MDEKRLVKDHAAESGQPAVEGALGPKFPAPRKRKQNPPMLPARYACIEEIGRGGIGAVWRVHDRQMDRPLAAKILLPKFKKNRAANERLKREALLAGTLQHPGVPPIYEKGELISGSSFFTMKLVEGKTLDELLRDRKSSEEGRQYFLNVFRQVAEAVGFAHSKDVIHRDLKPQNVMVGEFGEVQIMDWGMAKRLGEFDDPLFPTEKLEQVPPPLNTQAMEETNANSLESSLDERGGRVANGLTRQGDVFGTPHYMAPEQARGEIKATDRRSDVFSLGAILFEILTGDHLYQVGAEVDIVQVAARGDTGEALALLKRSSIDGELVELCTKALSTVASDRQANGQLVAKDIAIYLESVETRLKQAERETAAAETRVAEQKKRQKIVWSLVSAIGLAALIGIASFLIIQNERHKKQVQLTADVQQDLVLLANFRDAANWPAANETVERLQKRMANATADELRREVEQAKRTLRHSNMLDDVRQSRRSVMLKESDRPIELWEVKSEVFGDPEQYRNAIDQMLGGLDLLEGDLDSIVGQIKSMEIGAQVVAGLDEWALIEPDSSTRDRVLAIAKQVDPDTLRDQVRNPAKWVDGPELIELAEQLNPQHAEPSTLLLLASCLHKLPSSDQGSDKKIRNLKEHKGTEVAIAMLERAVPWHLEDYWLHMRMGHLHRFLMNHTEAAAYFLTASSIRPTDGYSLFEYASAKFESQEYVSAEAAIRKAVELDPSSSQYQDLLAKTLLENAVDRDSYMLALAAMEKTVELAPDSAVAHYNLAIGQERLPEGRPKAILHYQRCLDLNPEHLWARNNLGALYFREQRYSIASEIIQPILDDPNSDLPITWALQGRILAVQGMFDESIGSFRRARELYLATNDNKETVAAQDRNIASMSKLRAIKELFLDSPNLVDAKSALRLGNFFGRNGTQGELAVELIHRGLSLQIEADEASYVDLFNGASLSLKTASESQVPARAKVLRLRAHRFLGEALMLCKVISKENATDPVLAKRGPPEGISVNDWHENSTFDDVRGDELAKLSEEERTKWGALWLELAEFVDQ